jgi:hypothetical protein
MFKINITALFVCLALGACATSGSFRPNLKSSLKITPPKPLLQEERKRLAAIASSFIGKSKLLVKEQSFRPDCSGAIRAIFAQAGLRLGGIIKKEDDNDVKAIYRYVYKYGRIEKSQPEAGDLVFFHNTFDRSRNGKMNNALTHIGLVEQVSGETVFFVHYLGQAIIRSRLNLSRPEEAFDTKTNARINHILRKATHKERAYTTAELFAGFGRL